MDAKGVRADEQCQTVARVVPPVGIIGELSDRAQEGVDLAGCHTFGSQRVSGMAEQVLQPEAVAVDLGSTAAGGQEQRNSDAASVLSQRC
jgi:hypothetical protein